MLKVNSVRRKFALINKTSSVVVHGNKNSSRFYSSDFKEVKSESPGDKKIDPELEAMIKNDQANLETDEKQEQETKTTGIFSFRFLHKLFLFCYRKLNKLRNYRYYRYFFS